MKRLMLAALVCLLWTAPVEAQVSRTGTPATASQSGTTCTIASYNNSGGFLVVGVGWNYAIGTEVISGVTFNGVALTSAGAAGENASSSYRAQLWYLNSAPSTTANVVVTWAVAPTDAGVCGVTSYNGVDGSSPVTGFTTASGNAPSTTISVTTSPGPVSGDMVIDQFFTSWFCSTTETVGANQTENWQRAFDGSDGDGGSSQQAGADGAVMTWTISAGCDWVSVAMNIKQSAGGAAATPRMLLLGCCDEVEKRD